MLILPNFGFSNFLTEEELPRLGVGLEARNRAGEVFIVGAHFNAGRIAAEGSHADKVADEAVGAMETCAACVGNAQAFFL